MAKSLIISVEFEDDDDFDFYRTKFLALVEEHADEIQDPEWDGPKPEASITVSWDVEDDA